MQFGECISYSELPTSYAKPCYPSAHDAPAGS